MANIIKINKYIPQLFFVGILMIFLDFHALAADIATGYKSSNTLVAGVIVAIDDVAGSDIIPANDNSDNQPIGVVVSADGSLLVIDDDDNKTPIATSGRADVLVTNLYGDIKQGDVIGLSPISGVGAKGSQGSKAIGIAQSNFNSTSSVIKHQSVNDDTGSSTDALIGSIPVTLNIGGTTGGVQQSGIAAFLSGIVHKPVSDLRLIILGSITTITIIVLSIMLFSSIKSGFSAIGRNPLAKTAVFESLAQVAVMMALICIISLGLSYAVLRI